MSQISKTVTMFGDGGFSGNHVYQVDTASTGVKCLSDLNGSRPFTLICKNGSWEFEDANGVIATGIADYCAGSNRT